ncbi:MAG TPA: hypothetical protein VGD22_03460 [Sphingobacteriaceae bacterium]
MEKKDIFRKVGMIMGELNEQYQYLSERPENLNDLELELFLANSNFLTDHIEILRKMNGALASSVPVQEPLPIEKPFENNTGDDHVNNSDKKMEVEPEEPTHGYTDDEVQQVEEVVSEPEPRKEEVKPEAIGDHGSEENKAESQVLADAGHIQEVAGKQPVDEVINPAEEIIKEVVIPEKTITVEEPVSKPTINEIISASKVSSETVAKQFTNQPVGDLKSIINLNDKLLFIKDLFNGYSLAYSEAIELLNRFDSLEAADNFLKANYASKNNWNEKQSTVEKFYDVLNRRFVK